MKKLIERLITRAMEASVFDPVPPLNHVPYNKRSARHKVGYMINKLSEDEKEQLKNITSEDFQGRLFE